MADGIYLGMAGASARSQQLDSIADALANTQSPGYKAERPAFESFLPVGETSGPAYPAAVQTQIDLTPGTAHSTGNPLDVLPENGAFLGVQLPSGETRYTRDGRVTVDAQGQLRVASGYLLGNAGPIQVPPESKPVIQRNGVVSVDGLEVDRVATFQLAGKVERAGRSTYQAEAALPAEADLRTGEIELGNASPLEAMVQMVSAQRGFEHGMQAIETYKHMSQTSADLGKVR